MLSKTMTERTHSAIWSRFEDTEESQVPPKRPGVLDQRAENTFNGTPQHGLDELLDETFRIAPESMETDGLADRPSIQPKASWAYHHSTCSVEQSQPAERDDLYVKLHH